MPAHSFAAPLRQRPEPRSSLSIPPPSSQPPGKRAALRSPSRHAKFGIGSQPCSSARPRPSPSRSRICPACGGTQITIIAQSATCPKFSFRLSPTERLEAGLAPRPLSLPLALLSLSLRSVYSDPNWFLPSPTWLPDNAHLP